MKSAISLHNFSCICQKLPNSETKYIEFVATICQHYHLQIMQIDIILLCDNELHTINHNFLNHDTYTDIITFPYHQAGEPIWSDIYISYERMEENSRKYEVSLEQEFLRLLAHGILHLAGMRDKKKEEQEEMRAAEDFWIKFFQNKSN